MNGTERPQSDGLVNHPGFACGPVLSDVAAVMFDRMAAACRRFPEGTVLVASVTQGKEKPDGFVYNLVPRDPPKEIKQVTL